MSNWVINSTERYLSLIYDRLHELIYESRVIHADESQVKVMCTTHPIVLFDWQASRKTDHPRDFLKDFSSNVVTGGYQVYHKLADEREDLKVAGCWIHARRPFADFIKSIGLKTAKSTVAQEAYGMITDILRTDNEFDDLSNTDRKKQRQAKLQEKVDAYFKWVKQKYGQVTHNSTIGKVLAYGINQ